MQVVSDVVGIHDFDWKAMVKVDDISTVVVMDVASTFGFADRTGLKLRHELSHKSIKNGL